MPQSLSKVILHTVFSTKYRQPLITPEIEKPLFSYIGGIIKDIGGVPIIINGMPDHIHILSSLPRTITIADYIREIKRGSSKWIKSNGLAYKNFGWQNGYGTFAVSFSQIENVRRYILNQKEHHRKTSYRKELLQHLDENDVEYEKMYL